MAFETPDENNNIDKNVSELLHPSGKISLSQVWLVLFIIAIVLPVPLALIYTFCFYKKTFWYRGLTLFALIVAIGYISNLLFYRTMIMKDKEAKIDKISRKDALYVFWNTLAAFVIVAITMFGIGTNPNLITVFENTLGYQYIHFWGLTSLMNDIVQSNLFEKIDSNDFSYNFLITQINMDNVDDIIKMAEGKTVSTSPSDKFPLDFRIVFDGEINPKTGKPDKMTDQKDKLRNLVATKNAFGHFMWMYLSSLVAILVSLLACVINS
jgi:hypothetical protein